MAIRDTGRFCGWLAASLLGLLSLSGCAIGPNQCAGPGCCERDCRDESSCCDECFQWLGRMARNECWCEYEMNCRPVCSSYVPDPVYHGYHATTWQDWPSDGPAPEMQILPAPEELPAAAPEARRPSPRRPRGMVSRPSRPLDLDSALDERLGKMERTEVHTVSHTEGQRPTPRTWSKDRGTLQSGRQDAVPLRNITPNTCDDVR